MTELKVEFPIKLNGVFVTEDVHFVLNEFQTNRGIGCDNPEYNNGGIASLNEYISDLNNYIIEIMALSNFNEKLETEKEMLTNLHWIRERINRFKIPDNFLSPIK